MGSLSAHHAAGKACELQRWNPLKLSGVGSLLDNAGWSLEVIRDVSTDYERWYRNFATRIHDLQPILVQECGIEQTGLRRAGRHTLSWDEITAPVSKLWGEEWETLRAFSRCCLLGVTLFRVALIRHKLGLRMIKMDNRPIRFSASGLSAGRKRILDKTGLIDK